jgi:predicted amidohydrolase YtcJ
MMDKVKSDLVLINGEIYTVDKSTSWAQAVAISGERIVFIGTDKDVEALVDSETEVIDLEGKMVLPGFIDAHAHPSQAMDLVGNINLYAQDSLEKYEQTIKDFVESHVDEKVFRGSGWNDAFFPNNGPTKEILDALVPDHPISLVSYDGHSLWVNSVTLDRAKINKDTPSPEGGVIERDPETGEPNGTLRETASKLIDNVIPDYSIEERVNALLAYQKMANKGGVTTCHDAMLDEQSIAGYKALQENGALETRFRGAIEIKPDSPVEEQMEMLLSERAHNSHPKFQTNTAKLFVDGVVEGGTAYLLEPYQHMPDFCGELIWDPQKLKEVCAAIDKEKIQIHIHVIGDAAARIALDALEYAQQLNGKRDARHLISHLQLVTPGDILRFEQLGVIGVPNPYWFKVDDYYWSLALPYLGKDRADHEYPMQSFLEAGVLMASASDFPVTIPFDPLIGIETGITRSEIGTTSKEILWPEERASLEAMIASFTINGATANFLEDDIGSLELGKAADFIVLDQNLFQIPPNDIAKTKVLRTYIDGKEVYRAEG